MKKMQIQVLSNQKNIIQFIDQTTTLNKFFKKSKLGKIKLLKLEAEGYEPEILLGANKILDKIEYIAIDGGYERGKNSEETLSSQLNFL